jgi:hypothetical protein
VSQFRRLNNAGTQRISSCAFGHGRPAERKEIINRRSQVKMAQLEATALTVGASCFATPFGRCPVFAMLPLIFESGGRVGISVERACDGNVITLNHRLRMMVRDRAWRWVPRRIVVHQDHGGGR